MKNQQDITKRSLLLVVVMVVGVSNSDALGGDLSVSSESRYCKQHPSFIFCDFLGAQEVVELDSLARHGGQTVTTVYVQNAKEMLIGKDICASLMAFNVGKITYSGIPDSCPPSQQFAFRLVDSLTNLVPPYVSQIDMKKSAAVNVNIDRDLRQLSVVDSLIGHLNVSLPVKAQQIKIEHSVINSLEKLHLVSKAELILDNVTINEMSESSLYLEESTVNIRTGNIKTSMEQAIILGPKASVTLEDIEGEVSLAGPQEVPSTPPSPPPPAIKQEELRPPGVPTRAPQCSKPSTLLWVFPTVLAAVEAVIIIINCTNWFPSLKGKRVSRGLEEGSQSIRRQTGIHGDSSYSSWYYNTEVPHTITNRRQNVVYDKYA